ncbi:MAG: penicillin acylase family protein [Pyrinomonadaceae bacterium]|nr:penicillin acylase family protein [Pyrinomonadaceae bacterium]
MNKNIAIIISFAFLTFSFTSCYAQAVPKIDSSVEVSGLKEDVIVRRDSRSIPYIKAENDADLYFAQGFETARDRLWQMDLLRRVARGRLAELFGKRILNEDKRWRRFGFSEIAKESLSVMNPNLRKALEDYARGVNAYTETLDQKSLPIEFQILQYRPEKWDATDTIVIGKILADGLSTTWWKDLNQVALKKALSKEKYNALTSKVTPSDLILFGKDEAASSKKERSGSELAVEFSPKLNEFIKQAKSLRKNSLSRIGFYAERLAASNNWVISGKRTADGKAIIANDPHLPGTAPGIWYLTHLSTPEMTVSGVTFPGVPGIVLGHNSSIAWGATNVGPDVQDLYIEDFNEKGEYLTPQGWKKPKVRTETIRFRPNLMSPKLESEELKIVETRNGVVFREDNGKKIALKWTARDPKNQEFDAFFLLNRAKDWKDFKNALRTYGGASQNFVYADTVGNIGWYVAGKIPIRRSGFGEIPYDGSTDRGDWLGNIPFDELPSLYNPESGFIVTANQRIVGTGYKYQQMNRQFAAPWRARRILEMIKSKDKVTLDFIGDIQHDTFNLPLAAFSKELVKRNAASAGTIAVLRGWDGKMTADSVGATVANEINRCVGREIAAANKPASQWQIRQTVIPWAFPNDERLWLPRQYDNWNKLVRACDSKSIAALKKRKGFGDDKKSWLWGKYRTTSFQHPLALAPLIGGQFKASFTNVDGSGQTPNVGGSVSMRHIAKPGAWDETRHVIPLGQSGDSQSPHWKDQFESWRTGKSSIFPFSRAAVARATAETKLLKRK